MRSRLTRKHQPVYGSRPPFREGVDVSCPEEHVPALRAGSAFLTSGRQNAPHGTSDSSRPAPRAQQITGAPFQYNRQSQAAADETRSCRPTWPRPLRGHNIRSKEFPDGRCEMTCPGPGAG